VFNQHGWYFGARIEKLDPCFLVHTVLSSRPGFLEEEV
jgi:hypothetical protein